MEGANSSLTDFVSFLGSSNLYGSMTVAAGMMGWLINLVVTILMIAAVVGVAFIVFKFACDVVFLSGLGHMLKGGRMKDKLQGFTSEEAMNGDIMAYLKKDAWKLIVTLAFVGILASGMALPLAGQVAGVIGAALGKLVGLDLASQVANFDLDDFTNAVGYMNAEEKKSQYELAVGEMKTYRDQLYKIGASGSTNLSEVEIEQIKTLYKNAYDKAQALADGMADSNLPATYLEQHTKKPICVTEFDLDVTCN